MQVLTAVKRKTCKIKTIYALFRLLTEVVTPRCHGNKISGTQQTVDRQIQQKTNEKIDGT